MRIRLISLAITLLATLALAPGAWAAPTTFTVDSIGDARRRRARRRHLRDQRSGCTLRAAIQESNATTAARRTRSRFDVSQISVPTAPARRSRRTAPSSTAAASARRRPATTPNAPNARRPGRASASSAPARRSGCRSGRVAATRRGVAIYDLAITNFPCAGDPRSGARTARGSAGNLFGRAHRRAERGRTRRRPRHRPQAERRHRRTARSGNIIGGPSNAQRGDRRACDRLLQHDRELDARGHRPRRHRPRRRPATRRPAATGGADEGTTIAGNWIGVCDAAGTPAPNAVAAKLGDALETSFGTGSAPTAATSSPGNTKGIDQGSGTTSVVAPRRERLRHQPRRQHVRSRTARGTPAWAAATRSAAARSSRTARSAPPTSASSSTGPRANVIGNLFHAPDSDVTAARFTTAAIRLRPAADSAYIGSNIATVPRLRPVPSDYCNTIARHRRRRPGIWVDGADDARIWRNAIGAELAPPDPRPADPRQRRRGRRRHRRQRRRRGPPQLARARRRPGRSRSQRRDEDRHRRQRGPAPTAFDAVGSLFTDLLPDRGPGQQRHRRTTGSRRPAITVSSITGVGGTASRARTIHVLLQEGPAVVGDPDPIPEGSTYPPTAVGRHGRRRRHLGRHVPRAAEGSARSSSPRRPTADGIVGVRRRRRPRPRRNPPPIVTFQSGPSGRRRHALGDVHVHAPIAPARGSRAASTRARSSPARRRSR